MSKDQGISKSLQQLIEQFSSQEFKFSKYINIEALAERVKEIGLHHFLFDGIRYRQKRKG